MRCPFHGETLVKQRGTLSLVCPRCSYKVYDPNKYWLPEVRHTIEVPSAFAWSTWTTNGLTTNGVGDLVLSSGHTSGYAISPQMINLTKKSTRYFDCTKVKLVWTHTLNTGKVEYFASNDGGVGYRVIKTSDAIFQLNEGNEIPKYRQSKYDDLRIKIELSRTNAGDTSSTVNKVIITYNKVKL